MWCRICTTIGEVNVLPNIKSAKKRVKVTESKTLQNQMFKTSFKTTLKKFEKAVEAGDKAVAETCYKDAVSKIDKAVAKGVHAGKLVKAAAQICQGNGGGKPDMAQAGGKDASKVEEALENLKASLHTFA